MSQNTVEKKQPSVHELHIVLKQYITMINYLQVHLKKGQWRKLSGIIFFPPFVKQLHKIIPRFPVKDPPPPNPSI